MKEEKCVQKKYKDTVFRMLFGKEERANIKQVAQRHIHRHRRLMLIQVHTACKHKGQIIFHIHTDG